MNLKTSYRAAMLQRGVLIGDCARTRDIEAAIGLMRPVLTGHDLVRIGGAGDGGYLVPDDMAGVSCCFSPGVSDTANFEAELALRHGIRSFLADASVDNPPLHNDLFSFEKKFLGTRAEGDFMRLSSWVESKSQEIDGRDCLLQMDIEGAEYGVLIDTPLSVLQTFRIMIIEFHHLDVMFEKRTLPIVQAILDKLTSAFAVAHLHANNCCGIATCRGIGIPRVFEATLIRKDRLKPARSGDRISIPHPLDATNVAGKPDIAMPDVWWS